MRFVDHVVLEFVNWVVCLGGCKLKFEVVLVGGVSMFVVSLGMFEVG